MWVGVLCCIDLVWSSNECACCVCDPSVHLSVPSIGFVCFCMSEVIDSFKSLRAGSEMFALLILFLCVILHTMWSVNSLQLLYLLLFGMVCLSAISMMFKKIMLAVCVCLSDRKRILCFRELCPVSFLVVRKGLSVLL